MSKELKEKHMKRVFTRQLASRNDSLSCESGCLDVSSDECSIKTIQSTTLHSIWNKAANLLKGKSIIPIPWMTDNKARLVESSSSEQPHLVTASNNCYKCDKCPMFKGYNLCSHVVAVAQKMVTSMLFYRSKENGPNLSSIALEGMPAGAGKKSGTPNRKRKKNVRIETRSVRPFIDESASPSSVTPTTVRPSSVTPTSVTPTSVSPTSVSPIIAANGAYTSTCSSGLFNVSVITN